MTTLEFNTAELHKTLQSGALSQWAGKLTNAVDQYRPEMKHGHLPRWQQALASLPPRTSPCSFDTQEGSINIDCSLNPQEIETVQHALRSLRPWRKGPFAFDTIFIDTEWRSDWKWDRIIHHLQPLTQRLVLDVGCGNGYYLWRMLRAGARQVLGIDPSLHYLHQFLTAQHFIQSEQISFLPLPLHAMPENLHAFDVVFSMGVLYHRRDPGEHMRQLHQALVPGGELVLETLIIDNEADTSLAINGRYANMRNVYELPSVARLTAWLEQAGFTNTRCVSINETDVTEQRRTEWMTSYSLAEALDQTDPSRTVEGAPRPLRAVMIAEADA